MFYAISLKINSLARGKYVSNFVLMKQNIFSVGIVADSPVFQDILFYMLNISPPEKNSHQFANDILEDISLE